MLLPNREPEAESQLLIHGRDGTYLMEKNKWPILTLPEEKEPVESYSRRHVSGGKAGVQLVGISTFMGKDAY